MKSAELYKIINNSLKNVAFLRDCVTFLIYHYSVYQHFTQHLSTTVHELYIFWLVLILWVRMLTMSGKAHVLGALLVWYLRQHLFSLQISFSQLKCLGSALIRILSLILLIIQIFQQYPIINIVIWIFYNATPLARIKWLFI